VNRFKQLKHTSIIITTNDSKNDSTIELRLNIESRWLPSLFLKAVYLTGGSPGKRVVSKVDNLCFYDSLSWQDKDVAGTVDTGLGFAIDAKVTVNGSTQYKVHNSKGNTYYITASEILTKPTHITLSRLCLL